MVIRRSPFSPFDRGILPHDEILKPYGGYLKTPLIRPLTTSEKKDAAPKAAPKDEEKK